MFKHLSIIEQIAKEREKNETFTIRLNKTIADMEYMAMMSDIELDEEGEEDAEE